MTRYESEWEQELDSAPFKQKYFTRTHMNKVHEQIQLSQVPRRQRFWLYVAIPLTTLCIIALLIFPGTIRSVVDQVQTWFQVTDESRQPESKKHNDILTLFSEINLGGKYGFEDLPWLITKQDVMAKLTLEVVEDPAGQIVDRIVAVGNLDLPAVIEQRFIYGFQDNQFLYWSSWFYTSDEQAYVDMVEELGQPLYDLFGEPKQTKPSLEMFDQATESADRGSRIFWIGEDDSYLNIYLGRMGPDDHYLLTLSVSSPRPFRSLAPTDF